MQILTALQTNDPIDLADIMVITKTHYTSDVVLSVLDLLHIMGVVVKLQVREEHSSESGVLPLVPKKRTKDVYYALAGYCRCSDSVDLRRISQHLEAKTASIAATEKRVAALRELTGKEMSPSERVAALKSFVQSSLIENKALAADPLYVLLNNVLASSVTVISSTSGPPLQPF